MYMGNIGAMGRPLRRLIKPRFGPRPIPTGINPRFQRYGGDMWNIRRTISREGVLGPPGSAGGTSRYMRMPSRRIVTMGGYDYEYDPLSGVFSKIGKKLKKGVKKLGKAVAKIAPVAAFIPGVGTAVAAAGAAYDVYKQRKDTKAAEAANQQTIDVPMPQFDPATGQVTYVSQPRVAMGPMTSPAMSMADVAKMLAERDAKQRAEQAARRKERELAAREAALRTAEQNRMLAIAQAPQGPTSPAPIVETVVERDTGAGGGLLQNPGVLIGGAALLALLLRR